MDTVKSYNCYDYNEEWYLIEIVLDVPAWDIDWGRICVPQEGVRKSNWQCAFMEQYLNEDGTAKICEAYDEPEENVCPCRVVFFIFKVSEKILSTPYGSFELSAAAPVPDRLKSIVEFEGED